MNSKLLRWLGIALIIQTGLLHLYAALGESAETPYLNALFVANFAAALIAAFGLLRSRRWGWMLGALLAIGSLAGYVVSRTAGLPGMEPEAWGDPIGTLALVMEAGYLLTWLVALLWRQPDDTAAVAATPMADLPTTSAAAPVVARPSRFVAALYPLGAFAFVLLFSAIALRWDGDAMQPVATEGNKVEIVTITPETFEDEYGVRVNLIAVTAMRGIVDLRLKITDVDKAKTLLEDESKHPAMWIGDQSLPNALIPTVDQICGPDGTLVFTPQNPRALIMPAHMGHMDKNLKDGGMYIMFYPNPQNTVQSGTPISLFFGNTRVGPLTVQ